MKTKAKNNCPGWRIFALLLALFTIIFSVVSGLYYGNITFWIAPLIIGAPVIYDLIRHRDPEWWRRGAR